MASSCYTDAEAEAEQGIKIQSELMVISLNCSHKHKAGEPNLYTQYQMFKQQHGSVFEEYELKILAHYREGQVSDPDKALRTLRTNFANQISSEAASLRPDVFCHYYAPRISKAGSLSEDQLRRWAGTFYATHPPTKPICEN